MNTTQVGIDIAKAVFEVALSDRPGTVLERHRFSRERFRRFFAARDATDVLMEACGSAHYWGRELQAMGHRIVLLHPRDVARYRDGNKTDRADAKAILEAARNSALDPVPVKSCEQQAIASLHRMRQGYLQTRTARINAVRAHLRSASSSPQVLAALWLMRRRPLVPSSCPTSCGELFETSSTRSSPFEPRRSISDPSWSTWPGRCRKRPRS